MTVSTQSAHNQKVREVAENYRRRGYSVYFQPATKDLPAFLKGYRPDIIAKSPEESVVVEVKGSEASKPDDWRWLAQTMLNEPHWRLHLVVPDPTEIPPSTSRLSKTEIKSRLKQAEGFAAKGSLDLALLVTWTATEAALRRLCDKYEVELPDDATGTVITRLYTDSLMEREDYDVLMNGLTQRAAVAHGYKPDVSLEDITRLRGVAETLLAE